MYVFMYSEPEGQEPHPKSKRTPSRRRASENLRKEDAKADEGDKAGDRARSSKAIWTPEEGGERGEGM